MNEIVGLGFCFAALFAFFTPISSKGADGIWVVNVNAHIVTFFISGLPGVILLMLLYRHFRQQQGTFSESLCLAGAFGAGTLFLPYSGIMMSHILTACFLFAAWHILQATPARYGTALFAGLLTGLAAATDPVAICAAVLFFFYTVRRHSRIKMLAFLNGIVMPMIALLAHNYLCFGNPLITNQAIQSAMFKSQGLFLGVFGLPDPIRLFWLTFHPFRGLFICCPVMLIPVLSWSRSPRVRELRLECVIPLLVIASFICFNLSFNGWTGGYGVGPRYLIPMLPFMFSFAPRGLARFPTFSRYAMVVSAILMFCVASVTVMVPGPNNGPPVQANPVAYCIYHLMAGQVSISTQGMLDAVPVRSVNDEWDSYNLGEIAGLRGIISLIPACFVLVVFAMATWRFQKATEESCP